MKLILTISLLFIISCTDKKIQVGQCVQRPDSPVVYEVQNIQDSYLIVVNQTSKQELAESLSISDNWGIVNCLY